MKLLLRFICFVKGHKWVGGAGGHTNFGDYQYLDCGRCKQRVYSVKDGKYLGEIVNGRLKK